MSFWCHCLDQNSNENIVRITALKVFNSFLGASWKLFGVPVGFISYITYQVPRKPPGSYKNFRAEILKIFLLLFWSKWWYRKTFRNLLTFSTYVIQVHFEGCFASIPDNISIWWGARAPWSPPPKKTLPPKNFFCFDGPERAHYAIIIRKRTSLGA